ncbi:MULTISPECIES: insecticidal delta-endotoxin Cry8Ea1 family protein [unclassified Pseudomonas]|uniref:insecticidal delta-endotoxin Cry8Ea1 family protein n=1 Tax=unclassified Pseudomonas TaxID=196821 RepID=UPI000BA3D1CC|nr:MULTISPECIES: insecticidal delta-endotoxin Cry8Ea1 family protein [unclassified Pseudomonas]MCU1731228.1 insecticidal delta-endotoxin Cry8Ea1 family protein [Pseudomonas sp. 20P_3.2_Bac4]MCU1744244.1 insecticidal delta-endotoxin Cry8Ea1 family protein [Pseudomonas sp. 20P_3.2_Bac5]
MEHMDRFVAENTGERQQSDSSAELEGMIKIFKDGTIEILNKDLIKGEKAKGVVALGGNVLLEAWKDSQTGNYNNTLRTLAIGSTALIPYGGIFISPMLGLLWPENVPPQDQMMSQLVADMAVMMDDKIDEYDIDSIRQAWKALMDLQVKFENSVNKKGAGRNEKIQAANVKYAGDINNKYNELVSLCQKSSRKVIELPMFTTIACAHVQFLKFMERNARTHPRIKMDAEQYQIYFEADLVTLPPVYAAHVMKTYQEGRSQAYAKVTKLVEGKRTRNYDSQKALKLWTSYTKFYDTAYSVRAFWDIVDLPSFNKATTGWLQEGPYYCYLVKGQKQTGWFKYQGKWYYASEEGQMVTGWFKADGKSYFASPKAKDTFKEGEMVTGWLNDYYGYGTLGDEATQTNFGIYTAGDRREIWYYLSPKGYMSDKFKEGEMVTGWFQIDEKWYFANLQPRSGSRIIFDSFRLPRGEIPVVFEGNGSLITDAKVEIDGKLYSFDKDGKMTG